MTDDGTDWGLLSNHFNRLISELDEEISETERKEMEDWRKEIGRAVKSLEGFAESQAQGLLQLWREEHIWDQIADDYYSREAVSAIRQIAERFRKLAPVLVGRIPSKEVCVYLREATRCFIYGFFQASIALSRAALEAGLNEHIGRKFGPVSQMELAKKIDLASRWKLVSGQSASMAHDVRRAARRVLHQEPVKENLAFDTLVRARGVLKNLFKT